MNIEKTWNEIIKWLSDEKIIGLPKGNKFKISFNKKKGLIQIIPLKTGIPRIITKKEWRRFGEKFNQVKSNGYDPLRPGHYSQITHNSSYIVALLKELRYLNY